MLRIVGRGARGLAAAALLGSGLGACAITPRTDRDWYPYLAQTTHVETEGAQVTFEPVTDWTYTAEGPVEQCYRSETVDLERLEDVWFLLEPQPGSEIAAHTLLLFEFEGDELLGLTIEARREADEAYSAFRGLWNAYELSYLWGSAQDLVTRRVILLDHEVFIYPLALRPGQKRVLFERLAARTEALETNPRFYNTLFSNCTNELAKAAGLDWHVSFFLTGKSDEHLYRQGVIPGASFAEAKARADLTAFVRTLHESGAADFDAALLSELRRRRDGAETVSAE